MNKHTQLSKENRFQIEALLDAGHNQSEIARTIGVHRSTISRELTRNLTNSGPEGNKYSPEVAQQLTDQRHAEKPKHHRFTEDLKEQARQWLTTEKLSPELISGRWGGGLASMGSPTGDLPVDMGGQARSRLRGRRPL